MGVRERLKKTFSRRNSTATTPTSTSSKDPSDRSNSIWYQPGEKIPYKYRRPVEPEHKAKLDGFSWTNAWRRKSHQSQYSPMGSRMPSLQGSAIAPPEGVRVCGNNVSVHSGRKGVSSSTAEEGQAPRHHLEPIQSVQTASEEDVAAAVASNTARNQGSGFTQEQLEEAMKKVGTT
jgi:hypothetical protein